MVINMSKKDIDEENMKKSLFYLKKEKRLTEILENEIIDAFSLRGEKAIEVIKKNGVKKLIISKNQHIWEVKGSKKPYLIIDSNFCECYDFQIRVINRKELKYCYHLIAKILAEELNIFRTIEISSNEYNNMILERIKNIKQE